MIINESGGGAGLNLKVVGNPQPTSPKNNTIWVDTDTEINGYAFSATEPASPRPGMLWFKTGATSNAPINIDKKNTVMLYPNICQQYINGAWVSKTAKIYSSAKWSELWDGGLYVGGNQYEAITGGWWNNYNLSFKGSSTYPGNSDLNLAECLGDYISLSGKNGYFSSVTTKNKIDLSNFSTLNYDVLSGSDTDQYIVFIHDLESGTINNNSAAQAKAGPVDISSIEGSYYITVGSLNVRTVKVANLRVE